MFIETSSPRKTGDNALLNSQRMDATGSTGKCVKFWYHMYGSSIGTLNVYIQTGSSNASRTLLWTLTGNQRNQWYLGQIPHTSSVGYRVSRRVRITTVHAYMVVRRDKHWPNFPLEMAFHYTICTEKVCSVQLSSTIRYHDSPFTVGEYKQEHQTWSVDTLVTNHIHEKTT